MGLFFTADEHYDHRNIIDYCKRPFSNVDEMRETLIDNHNRKVSKSDMTIHVGDMFWRTQGLDKAHWILNRLNGNHAYIWGNHCELIENNAGLQKRFAWIKDIHRVIQKGIPKIVLCHYAMRVWRGSHQGAWHLYGHSHGELPEQGLSFDCGVDCNNFEPISLEEVMIKMYQKHGDKAFDQVRKEKEQRVELIKLLIRTEGVHGTET